MEKSKKLLNATLFKTCSRRAIMLPVAIAVCFSQGLALAGPTYNNTIVEVKRDDINSQTHPTKYAVFNEKRGIILDQLKRNSNETNIHLVGVSYTPIPDTTGGQHNLPLSCEGACGNDIQQFTRKRVSSTGAIIYNRGDKRLNRTTHLIRPSSTPLDTIGTIVLKPIIITPCPSDTTCRP